MIVDMNLALANADHDVHDQVIVWKPQGSSESWLVLHI